MNKPLDFIVILTFAALITTLTVVLVVLLIQQPDTLKAVGLGLCGIAWVMFIVITSHLLYKPKNTLGVIECIDKENSPTNSNGVKLTTNLVDACKKNNLKQLQSVAFSDISILKQKIENENNNTPLILAIEHKAHKIIKYITSLDSQLWNIDGQNNQGHTALMLACIKGDLSLVKNLLAKNADPSLTDTEGKTALLLAYENKNLKIVQQFAQFKNVDKKDSKGQTVFMLACKDGKLDVAKSLIAHANVNLQDYAGNTALMMASEKRNLKIIEFLLTQSVDLNLINHNEETALMVACKKGHLKIVELLVKHDAKINIDNQANNKDTALTLACKNRQPEVMAFLISHGANINQKGPMDKTPLMLACEQGFQQIVKTLIDKNSDPTNVDDGIDAQDTNGFTALMLAAQNGHPQIIQMLIGKGADIKKQNAKGMTALMLASQNGHQDAINALEPKRQTKNAQSTINTIDDEGKTALMHAIANGHLHAAEKLMNKLANTTLVDNMGNTLLIHACLNGHIEIANYLIERKIMHDCAANKVKLTPLMALVMSKTPEDQNIEPKLQLMRLIISKAPDAIESKDNEEKTAFNIACINGNNKMANILINEYAVDINTQDKYGCTPLIHASRAGNMQLVNLLIKHKADILLCSRNGSTALIEACAKPENQERIEVVNALLDHSNNINITCMNNSGDTALLAACKARNKQIVEILLKKGASIYITPDQDLIELNAACKVGSVAIAQLLMEHSEGAIKNKQVKRRCMSNALSEVIKAAYSNKDPNLAKDYIEVVSYIIKVLKQIPSKSKDSPELLQLVLAINGCNPVTVKILIDAGVDINIKTVNGRSPLESACELPYFSSESKKIIELLLANGADLNTLTNSGESIIASMMYNYYANPKKDESQKQKILLLIERCKDFGVKNTKGYNPLHIAVENNDIEITGIIAKDNPYINEPINNKAAAIHLAVQQGNIELTKVLLSNGADVNAQDESKRTSLHIAASNGNVEMIKLLLKYKADANLEDDKNFTPLHCAMMSGSKYLIQKEMIALILKETKDKKNLLIFACKKCSLGVVKLLVEQHDFDVNAKGEHGITPLIAATEFEQPGIVRYLLEQNADKSAQSDMGSAADYAARLGNLEIMKSLKLSPDLGLAQPHSVKIITQDRKTETVSYNILMIATHYGHAKLVEWILEQGCKIDSGNMVFGAKYIACLKGKLDVVQAIVEHILQHPTIKIDNDIHGDSYSTMLMIAAQNGHKEVVKYLIEKNASLNIKNADGDTALILAAKAGFADVVTILKERGADINIKNHAGHTALECVEKIIKENKPELDKQAYQKTCDAIKSTSFMSTLRNMTTYPFFDSIKKK